jgi:hypothetical protein
MFVRRLSSVTLVAGVLATVAACGDVAAPTSSLAPSGISRSGGSGGGGGGGGGGGTAVDGTSILPTTAPAPGILMRESFGPGPDLLRPTGGKGTAKGTSLHTTLNGFWAEWSGGRTTAWITPETGQTWKFCGGSADPYELPSPLQTQYSGCAASEWFDPPTSYPTALLPITVALPNDGYELSMEGYPAPIAGAYVAIGFTSSGAVTSNLTTSGALWLRVVDTTRFGFPLHYELRAGSLASGRILASGDAGASGWNRMAIRYSPAAGTVTLTYDGTVIGTYPFTMAAPKYAAFEGVGILDDFVLRQ